MVYSYLNLHIRGDKDFVSRYVCWSSQWPEPLWIWRAKEPEICSQKFGALGKASDTLGCWVCLKGSTHQVMVLLLGKWNMRRNQKPEEFLGAFFCKTNLEENIYEHILHVGQAALVHYVINHDKWSAATSKHNPFPLTWYSVPPNTLYYEVPPRNPCGSDVMG